MLTYKILSRGRKKGKRIKNNFKKKTRGRRGHGLLANTSKLIISIIHVEDQN